MKEGLNLDAARKLWKLKLEQRLPLVKREIERKHSTEKLVPCVADTCPEKYVELASRLVALQTKQGEFKREDLAESDMNKVKDFGKARNLSFAEAVAMLVENDAYVNYDVVEARHIVSLLEEFDEVYEKTKDKTDKLPMNLFEYDNRKWLLRHNNGLSNAEKMKVVLEVYRPELAGLEVVEHDYELLPRSRQVLSAEDVKQIKDELSVYADKRGNVDSIFAAENEEYFVSLCSKLKATGYTFERFLKENTDYHFTPCFKGDLLPTVKQMVQEYQRKYHSVRGMTENDPYLRYKVEAAQEVAKAHSTREFFSSLGIENDCPDHTFNVIGVADLKRRETAFVKKMRELYEDGQIYDSFTAKHERLYDELTMLASRLNFDSVDAYLASHGFERKNIHNRTAGRVIYLSDFDVEYYRLFGGLSSQEEIAKRCDELSLAQIDPAENLRLYRKLIYQQQDVRQKLSSKDKAKLEESVSQMN